MRKALRIFAGFSVIGVALGLSIPGRAEAQEKLSQLTVTNGEERAHMFPTVNVSAAVKQFASDTGPLLYHVGGQIMPSATTYAIFWLPSKLQNGNATSMSLRYRTVLQNMLKDYAGHGIGSNNTQYYQTIALKRTYIQNKGGLGDHYLDTSAYPASGCTDTAMPGNCITDAQIRAEIQKVMALRGWTGGMNNMFLLFTSKGEGSCLTSTSCAYTSYCAYHSFFNLAGTTVIYGNQPYGETSVCQAPGTPSPNGDAEADAAASIASHEVTEAITDPMLNAWYTAQGNEIADLCSYKYGVNTWAAGKANQMWNGHFYELQLEYDNHGTSCVQIGP